MSLAMGKIARDKVMMNQYPSQERQGRGWRTRADRRKTGYGDLCRYFQRSLGDNVDSEEAHDVNSTLH